jgi:predicted RNA-binding protein YlqC (UPF0109 family)
MTILYKNERNTGVILKWRTMLQKSQHQHTCHSELLSKPELRVAPSDMGKVIGRQGRTAKAIRTILNADGMRENRRLEFEIVNVDEEN